MRVSRDPLKGASSAGPGKTGKRKQAKAQASAGAGRQADAHCHTAQQEKKRRDIAAPRRPRCKTPFAQKPAKRKAQCDHIGWLIKKRP